MMRIKVVISAYYVARDPGVISAQILIRSVMV